MALRKEQDASVHDSQVLDTVVRKPEEGGAQVWADSAYRSDKQEQRLVDSQHHSQIHERAYRNAPLSEAQHASNKSKSRIRARVEHIFARLENSMGGMLRNHAESQRTRRKAAFSAPLRPLRLCVILVPLLLE